MKDVRKKAGGGRSVLGYLVPPRLINYNPPWKKGCGNKDALAVGWSGRVSVKDALPSR